MNYSLFNYMGRRDARIRALREHYREEPMGDEVFAKALLIVGASAVLGRSAKLELRQKKGGAYWWWSATAQCWIGKTLDTTLKLSASQAGSLSFPIDGERYVVRIAEPCSDALQRELDTIIAVGGIVGRGA